MTILEASVQVLEAKGQPMAVKDIFDEIIRGGLYSFSAKSPRSVLSGTLRNHVQKSSTPKIAEVSSGVYRLAQ